MTRTKPWSRSGNAWNSRASSAGTVGRMVLVARPGASTTSAACCLVCESSAKSDLHGTVPVHTAAGSFDKAGRRLVAAGPPAGAVRDWHLHARRRVVLMID